MGRSLKKLKLKQGLKRKKLSKLGHAVQQFSQVLLDIPSQFMMDVNMYQFTSKKTW